MRSSIRLLAGMAGIVAAMPAAAEPQIIQLPQQTSRDWVLNNAARLAIGRDKQLEGLNVGVVVKNAEATVWGTVPSPEIARRIEETLKKIGGISSVKNDCRIDAADAVPQAVAEAVQKGLARVDPDAYIKNLPSSPAIATSGRIVAKPNPDAPRKAKVDFAEWTTGTPMPPPRTGAVLLSPDDPAPVVEVVVAGVPTWERVRLSDARFKAVSLEVKAGVVKIDGVVLRMKDAWELAEKLNQLPDVKQVILGGVSEK